MQIRCRPIDGHRIELEVQNGGEPIPEKTLARVFEPFYTTKEQGQGVGLGLSVVYGIVERHHGRVEVDSRVGEGTLFRVHLPLRQPAGEDAPDVPRAGGEMP